MAKIIKLSLASVVLLTIFIIFVHPATMLLPAPYSKHAPILQLLLAAIGVVAIPLVALVCWQPTTSEHTPIAHKSCERLALICTRLC